MNKSRRRRARVNEGYAAQNSTLNTSSNFLLESWGNELQDIEAGIGEQLSTSKQLLVATTMNNTKRYLENVDMTRRSQSSLMEATQPSDVSFHVDSYINLLGAVMPNLCALDVVSSQPLEHRVGEVRYLKLKFGSNKGRVKAGDTAFSQFYAGNGETDYSSSLVTDEYATSVDGTAVTGNLAWLPVVPGTVTIEIAGTAVAVSDDGDGQFVGQGATGTVDYHTGEYEITLDSASDATSVTFSYEYDNISSPTDVPEVDYVIESSPIVAKSRKLKARWSFDASYDFTQDFSLVLSEELQASTAAQIKHEIDNEIFQDLLNVASAEAVTWNKEVPQAVALRDHYESFRNKIVEAQNNIFKATGFGSGNFIVVGTEAANVIESLDQFVRSTEVRPVGPHLAGYFGSTPVYKNPYYPADKFVTGWKGEGLYEAGYIYSPYMPILSTQLLIDETFTGRQGYATSYAKKVVNPRFYCQGTILG